jgi:cytochrome c-type biogenesis protein CcmF
MGQTASFKVFVNPLMSWMWVGGLVIALGVLVAAWPRKGATTSEVRARAPGVTQPAR